MSEKRMRQIRRIIYGDNVSNRTGRAYVRADNGVVYADVVRKEYQQYKRKMKGKVLPYDEDNK